VTYQLMSGPCAIAGNTLTGLDAGTCSVVATKAADAQYAAQTSEPIFIIVGLTEQSSLVVSASPSTIDLAGASTLSITGGDGTGAVAYSLISGPCSIAGTSVSGIGVGSCTITATKAASGSYAATTSAPLTITVGLTVQPPMTLTATPASLFVAGTSELNVSGGGGVGYVTYNVLSGPCALSGSLLIGVEAGACSVSATKASDGVYASVTSAPVTVSVGLTPQTALVLIANPASINVNGSSALSTSGGSGGGAVTYGVVSGPCSVTGSTLTGTGAGSCSVTATKAADSVYAEATSAPVTVSVGLTPQATLTLIPSATEVQVGQTVTLSTTGGSGNGAVTYSTVAQPINESPSSAAALVLTCGITGNVLTPTGGAGSCLVTATKAAEGAYAEATAQSTVRVTAPTPPPNPIPTMGEWARLVMMLMMIGAASWQTRRVIRRH
jgi:hypothetical protein